MKVGDLIKVVQNCRVHCSCFFCANNSSGIGIAFDRVDDEFEVDETYWCVLFDAGECEIYPDTVEVISHESR